MLQALYSQSVAADRQRVQWEELKFLRFESSQPQSVVEEARLQTHEGWTSFHGHADRLETRLNAFRGFKSHFASFSLFFPFVTRTVKTSAVTGCFFFCAAGFIHQLVDGKVFLSLLGVLWF